MPGWAEAVLGRVGYMEWVEWLEVTEVGEWPEVYELLELLESEVRSGVLMLGTPGGELEGRGPRAWPLDCICGGWLWLAAECS